MIRETGNYSAPLWAWVIVLQLYYSKNWDTCLNLYFGIDVSKYGVLFYVPILTHLFESFGSFIVKWLILLQIAIGLIAWSSLRLVHIHTQNLYTPTHRPPADFRLHNRCWTSAYQLLCGWRYRLLRLITLILPATSKGYSEDFLRKTDATMIVLTSNSDSTYKAQRRYWEVAMMVLMRRKVTYTDIDRHIYG